jgi:hypothetical protein
MNLHPPKKKNFWAAVAIAVAGMLVYAAHLISRYIFRAPQLHLQMFSFVLLSTAFVFLLSELTVKVFTDSKSKFYLILAIIAVLCLDFGISPWADYAPAFWLALFPVGMWLVYKLTPQENRRD